MNNKNSNRIVVDYNGARKLVLLGARDPRDGESIAPDHFKGCFEAGEIECAQHWKFINKEVMLKWLNATKGTDFEGFVVHFSDGSIFKFKSEDYMRLHRIISQFTFKRVLESIQDGTDTDVRMSLPEELLEEFDKYYTLIKDQVDEIVKHVEHVVHNAPKDSRKEFALYLQTYYKGTDVIKYAFRFMDLDYDLKALSDIVLKSLKHNDFVVEYEQTSN